MNPVQTTTPHEPVTPKKRKADVLNTNVEGQDSKVQQPRNAMDQKDSDRFKALSQRDHILKLSDTYIGASHLMDLEDVYLATGDEKQGYAITCKTIQAVPGLQKIFEEILNNAFDNVVRTREQIKKDPTVALCNTIKVTIDEDDGSIMVMNDGEGLPVTLHTEHKIYIPEMVFGRLLTSSNYDEQKKTWGGKNGLGSKCTNIYSTKFVVETGDHKRKLSYKQTWVDNMSEPKKAPLIKPYEGNPFTRITFTPDYKRFGIQKLSPDMVAWMKKRVIDIAGCTDKEVGVYLNNRKIPVKSFVNYINLYVPDAKVYYEAPHANWEIAVCASTDQTFHQVSLVNGIFTSQGGKHVDYVVNQITRKMSTALNSKRGSSGNFKPNHIRNNLWVFVNCLIPDPAFDSQTKERLTTAFKDFDAKFELSDKFIEKLCKSEIALQAQSLLMASEDAKMAKTDGKITRDVRGVPKLEDANWAGTKKSAQTILILTEGDSAKTMALAGLSAVGRDRFGVFPMRGKGCNVGKASEASKSTEDGKGKEGKESAESTPASTPKPPTGPKAKKPKTMKPKSLKTKKSIWDNKELQSIKKILGLQQGMVYTDVSQLRYGGVLIMTDADWDGSHIKGLLLQLFETFWPSLLKLGYVLALYTPAVKVHRSDKLLHSFYSVLDYMRWKEAQTDAALRGLTIKHYKGLGTSTRDEARDYFKNLKLTKYIYDANAQDALHLAFSDDADRRKEWLCNMNWDDVLDYSKSEIPISDFVHKELIHFSNASNVRAIPAFADGFKPVQRKIVYTVLEKNYKKEVKVFVLGGAVTSMTAYHHGDSSMNNAIVNLAQNFVGANNLNLLNPNGQFGSRVAGGDDAAQSRYIHTYMEPWLPLLFRREDDPLLRHEVDEGKRIEPTWYVPVLPMVLVNGASGMGTGYSTNIPQYNPRDIIRHLRNWLLNDRNEEKLMPWYRNFKGTMEPNASVGMCKLSSPDTLEITELPIGTWTSKYEKFLEKLIDNPVPNKPVLLRVQKHDKHDDINVHLFLKFERNDTFVKWLEDPQQVYKFLKLKTAISTSNMHLFSPMNKIVKFSTADNILAAFVRFRLPFYERQREYRLRYAQRECDVISCKIRFVEGMIAETINISKKTDEQILSELRDRHKFPPNPGKVSINVDPPSLSDCERAILPFVENYNYVAAESKDRKEVSKSDEKEEDLEMESNLLSDYDYLIKMPFATLSQKKLLSLKDEFAKWDATLKKIQSLSARDLWLADLEELEKVLP